MMGRTRTPRKVAVLPTAAHGRKRVWRARRGAGNGHDDSMESVALNF
jgi:hypothetical protein